MLIKYRHGFTIVEIMIVIAVISILATLSTVGYRGVQSRANDSVIRTDAQNTKDQIELSFAKNNTYPANLNALGNIPKDTNTRLAYVTTGKVYCLTVTSIIAGTNTYSVASEGRVTQGNCAAAGYAGPPSAPNVTVSNITTSSFRVNWSAISGVTNYTVRFGPSSPSSIAPGCSAITSTTCVITGLSGNTTYYLNVTATSPSGNTVSPQVVTSTQSAYAGAAPSTIVGCAVPSGGFNAGWPTSPQAVASQYRIYDYGEIGFEQEIAPYDSNYYVAFLSQGGNGESYFIEARYKDAAGNYSPWTGGTVTAGSRDCYD